MSENRKANKHAAWLYLIVLGLVLWPLVHILWDLAWGRFLVDPIQEIITRTGRAALNLLVLSLACTPLYTLTGFAPLLRARRTLGLYAFLYVVMHFLTFAGWDYGFDLRLLWQAIFYQRFVIVGFVAGVILLVLAITSTRRWQRRLGKWWKRLQRLVYLASVLAVLHFVWLLKEPSEALPYAVGVPVLLALRVPFVARTECPGVNNIRSVKLKLINKIYCLFRKKPQPVIVVSGLPRSGTSMMMKMLEAGGLEVLTDHVRQPNEDNPKGYYEFERVKKLPEGDTMWVKGAAGKVVKIISALLVHLPSNYTYKILFMRRSMEEILASQKQMLARRGESSDKVNDTEMAHLFEKHLQEVRTWLDRQPYITYLDVDYNAIMRDPHPQVTQVLAFLGCALDLEKMMEVVDSALYRQKKI